MTKYTKGPWRIDARLIAAAPLLYEALDALANGLPGNRWDVGLKPRIDNARNVLAKVIGEQK